jgi:cysteine dioxygenase type I
MSEPKPQSGLHRFFETRIGNRNLSPEELEQMANELAEQPELWQDKVSHSVDKRYYVEIYRDHHIDVWLLCWTGTQDTGLHDHDVSGGAVRVVEGELDEDRLVLGAGIETNRYEAGQVFRFDASRIHDVRNAGAQPATSLHLYSPPLWRMGYYEVGEDGKLARKSTSYAEEFQVS